MTILIPVSFEDFMKMRDSSHPKYQLWYVEKSDHFKLFMFEYADLIHFTKIYFKEFTDVNNTFSLNFAIDNFKRSYLEDGIKVEKVLISNLVEFDAEAPKGQELEVGEQNTNTGFNTPDQPDNFPSLQDLGIKT